MRSTAFTAYSKSITEAHHLIFILQLHRFAGIQIAARLMDEAVVEAVSLICIGVTVWALV